MPKSDTIQLSSGSVQRLLLELAQCRSRLASQDAELIRLRHDYSKFYNYYKENHQAHEILQRENNGLSRELENTTNLSNARGKELAGAQAFLSRADNISVVEVRALVDALNEEIFQTAASLGDSVCHWKCDLSDEEQRSRIKRLQPIVGEGLLRILSAQTVTESKTRTVNPLLVQVVAQIFLVDRCKYEVDQWDPNRPELSDSLTELYRGMRVSEQQTVFGRWRALTLAQIKPNLEIWRKDVLENLKPLLEFAGWTMSSSSYFDAFQNRLGMIFKTLLQVRQAIGRDVISEDYKIYAVQPGEPFRVASMKEEYGDNEKRGPAGSGGSGIVFGTTALGLVKMNVSPDIRQDSGNCVVLPRVVVNASFGNILTIQSSSERFIRSSSPVHHRLDGRG